MGRQSRSSRRDFLKGLGGSFLLGSTASLLPQLALIPKAVAQSSNYRALVCIYMAGANDSFNWLVPRDSESPGSHYERYRTTRGGVYSGSNTGGLALAFNDLLPISPIDSASYGLHPSSANFSVQSGGSTQNHPGLQTLFNDGKAAFVCNVGPLIQPINKTQYNGGAPRPAQLFSHNDQELLWHLGIGGNNFPQARFGWGGRVAKTTAGGAMSNGLSPTLSMAGSARFLIGDGILPYQLSSRTGIDLIDNYTPGTVGNNYSSARRAVLDELLADSSPHPFARGYNEIAQRSLAVGEALAGLLNGPEGTLNTAFPSNSLADQLRLVARMIKVSRSLGATRQVYYVRHGSFDLHQGMFTGGDVATTGHGALLTAVNQAIGAFWSALGEMQARDAVTTFTMSDFGRTLSGNGSGSDHAWGGHQLVLGEAVRGNRLYGRYPNMLLNADNNADQDWSFNRGQYIPTTSVDQFAATLARWMGVTDSSALDAMFPLLRNFSGNDLGFMA